MKKHIKLLCFMAIMVITYVLSITSASCSYVDEIMTSTGEELLQAVVDAVFEENVVDQDSIYNVELLPEKLSDERFVEILEYTRDFMVADYQVADAGLPEVADIINATQAVYAIDQVDVELLELLELYGHLLGDAYTDEAYLPKMIEIFINHNDFTSGDELKYVINWSSHLSILYNATDSRIAYALEKYADQYGIVIDNNVSLTRVARYFRTSNLEAIYGEEAFAIAYKKARAASTGTSGGGNSGSGSIPLYPLLDIAFDEDGAQVSAYSEVGTMFVAFYKEGKLGVVNKTQIEEEGCITVTVEGVAEGQYDVVRVFAWDEATLTPKSLVRQISLNK